MSNDKPAISCLPDGPYLLKNDESSTVALCIQKSDGEAVTSVNGVALCRCGDSKNKPYCDGSHRNNGFSGSRETDGSRDHRSSFAGRQITIHDNRGICAHAGYCTAHLSSVFRMGEEPWIDADGGSVEAIIDVVANCPSGALSYSLDGNEHRHAQQGAEIVVIKDGPYRVGGVELADQVLGQGVTSGRYTLCRCGASKNKPFCDGSHWDIGFKDDAD